LRGGGVSVATALGAPTVPVRNQLPSRKTKGGKWEGYDKPSPKDGKKARPEEKGIEGGVQGATAKERNCSMNLFQTQ